MSLLTVDDDLVQNTSAQRASPPIPGRQKEHLRLATAKIPDLVVPEVDHVFRVSDLTGGLKGRMCHVSME